MSKGRLFLLIFIIIIAVYFGYNIIVAQENHNRHLSFTTFFGAFGELTKSVDLAIGKSLPLNDIEEQQLGQSYLNHYIDRWKATSSDAHQALADRLLASVAIHTQKDFGYRVIVIDQQIINAYALPGGIVIVSRDLIDTLQYEDELAAILAHEIGHIELGHCYNIVKYEMLARKIKAADFGKLADIGNRILLRHSYGKTEENEADLYAFEALCRSVHDPSGLASSLAQISTDQQSYHANTPDIIRDYFTSHPPARERVARFRTKTRRWYRQQKYVSRPRIPIDLTLDSRYRDDNSGLQN